MLKWKLLIMSGLLVCSTSAFGQTLFLRNYSETVSMNSLDTSFFAVNSESVSIDISSIHKKPQNTIFINGPIDVKNSRIQTFNFKGSFIRHLVIDSSTFSSQRIYMDSTDFDSLFITNSTISQRLHFENVYVKNLNLTNSHFTDTVEFIKCNFDEIDFRGATFSGTVRFMQCTINNLNLTTAVFKSLFACSFNTINGIVNLQGCAFGERANLAYLITGPKTNFIFNSTILPDTLDFSGNQFSSDSISILSIFNQRNPQYPKCNIILEGTTYSTLRLDYSRMKLIFTKDAGRDEKEQTYRRLLDNLKALRFEHSYVQLDIEYKRFQSSLGTFGLLGWIPGLWWEYGYDKERVFKITFWSLLILTIINFFALNYLVTKVYPLGNIPAYYTRKNWNRLWFAFVYTAILFFSLSLRVDKLNFKAKGGTIYIMVIYAFGLVCLAYMANYIIQR